MSKDIHKKMDKSKALSILNKTFSDLASLDDDQINNFSKLLERIAEESRSVLGADLIEFYEYNQDRNEFILPQFKSGDYLVDQISKDKIHDDDIMHEFIKRKEPLYLGKPEQIPKQLFMKKYTVMRDSVPSERFYIREKIKSLAVVPIRTGEENVGLMFANFRYPLIFDEEYREIIKLFASQAAIIIKNARKYKQLYKKREALIKVGKDLNSNIRRTDENFIFQTIYQEAKDKLGIIDLALALYDQKKNKLDFKLSIFNDKPLNAERKLGVRDVDIGKTGWVATKKRNLYISSIEELEKSKFASKYYNPGVSKGYSWLGIPMMLGDDYLIGVLSTHNYERDHAFSTYDIETLCAFADIAAIAIHNVELYSYLKNEAKKLKSEIEEEKNLLKTVIDNIPAYIYAKDRESRFTIANKVVADIMGANSSLELLGKSDFEYYPPDEAKNYFDDEQNVIATEKAIDKEEISKDLNGKDRVTLTKKVPWKDTHNQIIGTIGIGVDITELYETKNRLNSTINQIPDHIYLKNKESRFILANKKVLKEFGVQSLEDVFWKTDFNFHPRQLAEEFFSEEQKIMSLELPPIINKNEKVVNTKTGKIKRLLTSKVPFKNDKDEVVGLIGINRDITIAYRDSSVRKISEAAYEADNLNQFYQKVYNILNEILPAENLYISIYIPEKQTLKFLFYPDKEKNILEKELPLSMGISGYVFRNKEPLLASGKDLNELEKKGKVIRIGEKSTYWMGVPLISHKEIGVINIHTYKENVIYDEDDLKLLKYISNPIALAIERILKKEEFEFEHLKRKKQLEALFQISEAARDAYSLKSLYKNIHKIIKKLMYAENFYIALYEGGKNNLLIPYFKDEKDISLPGERILKRGLSGYVLKQGEALLATSDIIDKLINVGEIEIIGSRPIDWVGVPLKIKNKTIGVIAIQTYSENRRYDDDDRNIIIFVSEQIAMAIDQVRLKEIQINLLEKISGSIIAPLDLDKVIEGILETAQELMDDAAICDVLLFDKKTENLKMEWVRGKEAKKNIIINLSEGITGWVAKERKPYLSNNVLGDAKYKNLNNDTRSELAVPIINQKGKSLIGVLNIEHQQLDAFNEEDKKIAMSLANLAAIAIENKKLIKERTSLKELLEKLSRIV